MLSLKGRGIASVQDYVETIAQRPLRLGRRQIKAGDQPMPCALVRDGLENGVVGEKRIAGKIHLRNQARGECGPEERKMNVGRTPGVLMIVPRIGPGVDG